MPQQFIAQIGYIYTFDWAAICELYGNCLNCPDIAKIGYGFLDSVSAYSKIFRKWFSAPITGPFGHGL
jgi:hypothetical protein